MVGSKSLVVNRFWIGKLGHLIVFYYNGCLSFMQIVDGHVILVSLVWCVQHDISLLENQDTCGVLEQHAPSLVENVCTTHALVPICLVPNESILVQPFWTWDIDLIDASDVSDDLPHFACVLKFSNHSTHDYLLLLDTHSCSFVFPYCVEWCPFGLVQRLGMIILVFDPGASLLIVDLLLILYCRSHTL
jgi:hypothetical protein